MRNILLFTGFLFLSFCVFAQEGSRINARLSRDALTVGVPFSIIIAVDYPASEHVNVTAPLFPRELTLDRIIQYPITSGGHTQTIVEYRIIANSPGRIFLGTFTVTTPAGRTPTNPFELVIQGENTGLQLVRMTWSEASQQVLQVGERKTFMLRASGWTYQNPPHTFFMAEIPKGVILSSSAPTAEERANGIAIKYTLIPLAAGEFILPARTLQHENIRFEIPPLNFRIIDR